VTVFRQSNDIVDWHIPLPAGNFSKVMMVLEVDDDTVWLTDGYSTFRRRGANNPGRTPTSPGVRSRNPSCI